MRSLTPNSAPTSVKSSTDAIDRELKLSSIDQPLLCKFRDSDNEHHNRSLSNGELWISDVLSLNDPFDSKPKSLLMAGTPQDRDKIRSKIRNAGVICFTNPPQGNKDELLLWSHYANGHRGYCLLINDPFLASIAQAVAYPSEYPCLVDLKADAHDFWMKVGFFKAPCWAYETEHRALFPDKQSTPYKLPTGTIWGSIFGCWSDPQKRSVIANTILRHSPKAFFFHTTVHPSNFALEYENATILYRTLS